MAASPAEHALRMPARWQQVALPMMVLGVLALGWEGVTTEVCEL